MAGQGSATVGLAPGLDLDCSIAELDGSVEVGLRHDGEPLERETIPPGAARKPFELKLGPLEVELGIEVDHSAGEVRAIGRIEIDDPDTDEDRTLLDLDRVVLRYGPCHGSVGGDPEPHGMVVDDPRFGRSRTSSKNVTRFFVDEDHRHLTDVGRVVKRELWTDYPAWVFNTVAGVGPFDAAGRGSYCDPTSIWFNVFLGYYQIDAPKSDWDRPFAYRAAAGSGSAVVFEEVVRLGKSDWNYFSNWMYGVPPRIVSRHDRIGMASIAAAQADAGALGSSGWHRVTLGGVEFVSAYEAPDPDADELVYNSVLSGLWRKSFGPPNPRPDWPESFIPSTLDADVYMSYWEDDEAFHTVIFGGTAPSGSDPAFLAVQLDAARVVIEESYPTLGFRR